jgi:molecular chaperone GrpE
MEHRDNSEFDPSEDGPRSEDTFASRADGTGGIEEPFASASSASDPADVTGAVGELEGRLKDQQERYLRLAAEYDNFRKRTTRERAELVSRAHADLVKQLLDPLDDLSRFAHVDPASADAATTVVQGVEMVEKKMLKTLTNAGLEMVDPINQSFDPKLHEAVATEPALSPEDDHVVARVYQVGYLFNGLLLRPARVVVKQWND